MVDLVGEQDVGHRAHRELALRGPSPKIPDVLGEALEHRDVAPPGQAELLDQVGQRPIAGIRAGAQTVSSIPGSTAGSARAKDNAR